MHKCRCFDLLIHAALELHMQNFFVLEIAHAEFVCSGNWGCHCVGVWMQVGGVLAELQAEQARLRQLCSQQAAAMQDLQRQAQQAAKQVTQSHIFSPVFRKIGVRPPWGEQALHCSPIPVSPPHPLPLLSPLSPRLWAPLSLSTACD